MSFVLPMTLSATSNGDFLHNVVVQQYQVDDNTKRMIGGHHLLEELESRRHEMIIG